MKLLPRSIRWRIQAWHGLVLLAVLSGFGATAYRLQYANAFRHLDGELQSRLALLHDGMGRHPQSGGPPDARGGPGAPPDGRPGPPGNNGFAPPPPPPSGDDAPPPRPPEFHVPAEVDALVASGTAPRCYYKLWSRRGDSLAASDGAPAGVFLPERTTAGVKIRRREGMREAYEYTPPGECMLVGTSEAELHREMARFAAWLFLCGGTVLVLGLAGGWWVATRTLAPIAQIGRAATRIASGHLEERIGVGESESELGQLAVLLNTTFSRLETAFAEQARFTSDAAHELRTPASIILAQTQLALARPRSAEELRETVETIRRAAQRMQSLIESLLALARLDAPSEPLAVRPCDLADLAREQIDLIRPLAEERGITLLEELGPSPCAADPLRLAQILTNLLSNAVKYSRPGDSVRLTTGRKNRHAVLCVADTGPGIAAEHLAHLFERFYRADSSRNRSTGGAGLGLAICKTIAEAHGGAIKVESAVEKGTAFTLSIPAGGGENGIFST